MKRLFVFVPTIVLVLLLLNSFVKKEDEPVEKPAIVGMKSFINKTPDYSWWMDPFTYLPADKANRNKPGFENVIFKSKDGGETWQNISKGLPETKEPVMFFAGESELYLNANNMMYHSKGNLNAPVWEKENLPNIQTSSSRPSTSIVFNHSGVIAFNYDGQIYQNIPAEKTWLPIHTSFRKQSMRTIFESADGSVLQGYDDGLYRSADKGKNWKKVTDEGWVANIIESDGVLIATGTKGIMRSTDDGEHWKWVIMEGGVGIAVENIDGGFAAIAYNTVTKSRRIHISVDNGKTWEVITNGLPASMLISSIKQVGKYLVCSQPEGVFRSADKGKTWNKVHSGIDNKVFKVYDSGNVLYAVAVTEGC